MADFITGLILGGLLVFFTMEYKRRKSYFITGADYKNSDNVQWRNMMNYDGSERGQKISED